MISAGGFGACLIPRLYSTHRLTLTICGWSLPTRSRTEPDNFLLQSYHLLPTSDLLIQVTTAKHTYPCSAPILTAVSFSVHSLGKATSWPLHIHKGHRRQYYLKNWKKKFGSQRPNFYSILLGFLGSTYLVRLEGWNSVQIIPKLKEQLFVCSFADYKPMTSVCFVQIPSNKAGTSREL